MTPRADKQQSQSPSSQSDEPRTSPSHVVVVQPNLLESAEAVVEHFGAPQHPQAPSQQTASSLQSEERTEEETNPLKPLQEENKEASQTDEGQAVPWWKRLLSVSDKNTCCGREMPVDIISATYATLVAAGGIVGYVKAGSIPSLAAGLAFGSVLGIGAYMTSVNPRNYYLTLGTATVLGGMMGKRFLNSGKFMPAGLITLLSVGMIVRLAPRVLEQAQEHYKK